MENYIMRILTLSLAATIALAANSHIVSADEVADQMVQDALPLMYHTCSSVVDETDGDEAMIVDVVGKMVALVFINRNIDIAQYAKTDEEKATVRADFIEALRAGCENDRDALLAGVVDGSVKSTLGL